jgi:protocatechuate 3,4-dioxygenase beta subunit
MTKAHRMDAGLPGLFGPLPPGSQPVTPIEGYPNTWRHNPAQPLVPRPATRAGLTGPLDLARKLGGGTEDLAGGGLAIGQLIRVAGRVLDEDGRPVRGAVVELWQANAAGRYRHPLDAGGTAPLDPSFGGSGRVRSDEAGGFAFTTVKPGAYPVRPAPGVWWRPPHIHFSVLGPATLSRLVTQMYFPGEPLNAHDRILNSVPHEAARARLLAEALAPEQAGSHDWLGFRFDIVLRGRRATPELP